MDLPGPGRLVTLDRAHARLHRAGRDEGLADRVVDDLDVDSLSMVEVVVAAEERFGVKIPDDQVQNLKTVGDAVSYITANA